MDGEVSLLDVMLTVDYMLGKDSEEFHFYIADLNNDNNISLIDLMILVDIILKKG